MQDQRKIDRRFLQYYMRVYDAGTHQQIGNLVDITPGGIMVVSEHPLPEGQNTRLRVELTDEVAEITADAVARLSAPVGVHFHKQMVRTRHHPIYV